MISVKDRRLLRGQIENRFQIKYHVKSDRSIRFINTDPELEKQFLNDNFKYIVSLDYNITNMKSTRMYKVLETETRNLWYSRYNHTCIDIGEYHTKLEYLFVDRNDALIFRLNT